MIGRGVHIYIYIYYIPPPLTVHFSMTRSVRYQPILHTLYYTLHTGHAYYLSYCLLNNVVITTVIEMVEMVEILDGRLVKRSVERVRYVINNLLHLVIVKYGDISLLLCISTRLRLVTILSLLVKYLVILHADPCNKSYIYIYIYLWSKKKFESYFRDRLTFSNVNSRTSRRIYRLALLLRAPETLSSLSKSRISIFNAHLTLLVRKMTSHNSIGKYRHLVN